MRRSKRIFETVYWSKWLFLWSLCLIGVKGFSQSEGGAAPKGPEVILLRADSLVQAGDWAAGIHEYNRYTFYAQDFTTLPAVYYTKGKLYKEQNLLAEAAHEFEQGASYLTYDSLFFELKYEWGLMEFLTGNYGEAARQLASTWKEAPIDSIAAKAGLMAVMAHNQRFDWNNAAALSQEVFADEPAWAAELLTEYQKLKETKFKSRTTAMVLSLLLPGTGQWYGGKFWRGVMSGLLILGFAAFTVFAVIWGRYFLAFFTPFSFFQRFYQGGWKYADTLVRLHNRNLQIRQAKEMNQRILDHIRQQ